MKIFYTIYHLEICHKSDKQIVLPQTQPTGWNDDTLACSGCSNNQSNVQIAPQSHCVHNIQWNQPTNSLSPQIAVSAYSFGTERSILTSPFMPLCWFFFNQKLINNQMGANLTVCKVTVLGSDFSTTDSSSFPEQQVQPCPSILSYSSGPDSQPSRLLIKAWLIGVNYNMA